MKFSTTKLSKLEGKEQNNIEWLIKKFIQNNIIMNIGLKLIYIVFTTIKNMPYSYVRCYVLLLLLWLSFILKNAFQLLLPYVCSLE